MKRSDFEGLGKVYTFTLTQQLKNKANLVSLIILLVFCLASVPVMTIFGGGFSSVFGSEDVGEPSELAAVCVVNETGLPMTPDMTGTRFEAVPVKTAGIPGSDTVQIRCYTEEDGYHISVSGGEEVDADELSELAMLAQGWLQTAKLTALGIDDVQITELSSGVNVNTDVLSDYLNPDEMGFEVRFVVTYVYAIIVMILCTYAATYIVRIIVEEKASRLVELLMVSVQPLALVLGKILAMMTYIFGMFIAMAFSVVLSYLVTGLFGDVSAAASVLEMLNLNSIQLNGWTIVMVLVSLLLAYSGFALMAGLAGTCCSQVEEIDGAVSTVMFTVMAGYMVSCFTAGIPGGGIGIFLALCPVVNVFCAPAQYVLGGIGLGWLIVSWVEQALIVAALAVLTARVYRQLLLSRGAKIKLRQLLSMAGKEAA